ncbi:MAG: IS630 family transposase [Planctomycetes bacterium]|nr:IS630 family transposase [Actinomycetota bacterium]MBU4273930.1 IS630 family transposase [Planctomycetota bacterium]
MRRAAEIVLSEEERQELERTARSRKAQVRDSFRAKMILLAAEGKDNKTIAAETGSNVHTVSLWRRRFSDQRMNGLKEMPGRGRKRIYDQEKVESIIEATLSSSPENATHWSTRTMAAHAGVSHTTVRRVWNAHEIKPHLVRTFKLSKDPRFIEKLRDVIGLYLNPPEHAIVLSVDEKSQIQALDRTQPGLPMKKGRCGTMTHDYKRNGTTTLFAALNVLEGKVIGTCMKRHRHQEYLKFLNQINRSTHKELDIHMIVDNYSTHKHGKVSEWMGRHPRFHVHYIPTSSSWLNLVERFFSELTEKRVRRGVFKSVDELTEAIYDFIDHHNENPKVFAWTKTADEIIEKLAPLYEEMNTYS